jgi:hypothetical protein
LTCSRESEEKAEDGGGHFHAKVADDAGSFRVSKGDHGAHFGSQDPSSCPAFLCVRREGSKSPFEEEHLLEEAAS